MFLTLLENALEDQLKEVEARYRSDLKSYQNTITVVKKQL